MVKRIYKYELSHDEEEHEFPADSRLLYVGKNPANPLMPCLWVEVEASEPVTEKHRFKIYGTGHDIDEPEDERHYIGTAVCESLVWHVFEVPTPEALAAEREYKAAIEASLKESPSE